LLNLGYKKVNNICIIHCNIIIPISTNFILISFRNYDSFGHKQDVLYTQLRFLNFFTIGSLGLANNCFFLIFIRSGFPRISCTFWGQVQNQRSKKFSFKSATTKDSTKANSISGIQVNAVWFKDTFEILILFNSLPSIIIEKMRRKYLKLSQLF